MADPRDLQNRLAERFAREAAAYRELWAPALRPHGVSLLDAVRVEDAGRVLDVGTGVGMLLPDIRDRAPAAFVAGVDLSEGMLALAPRAAAAVAVMDGSRLAFKPEAFDVLLMVFVLQFFPEPAEALWEARRVLRSGGRVGVAKWGEDPGCPAYDIWQAELDSRGAPDPEMLIANHALVDSTLKVRHMLAEAGFSSVRTWTSRLDNRMDVDSYLACRTRLSRSRQRFEGLDPAGRTECLARVRERLLGLDPEDLVERDQVVLATALRGPWPEANVDEPRG